MKTSNKTVLTTTAILVIIISAIFYYNLRTKKEDSNIANHTVIPSDPKVVDIPDGSVLWLNAGDLSVEANSPVDFWRDISGKENHASQTNELSRPVLRANEINGNSVVAFDGVDDGLIINDHESYKSKSLQLFIVCRSLAPHKTIIGYPHADTHLNPFYCWTFFHSSGPIDSVNLRINRNDINTKVSSHWADYSIYSYETNPRKLYINGKIFYEGDGKDISYPNATGLRIGFNANGKENFRGEIAEIIIYDRSLSDDERKKAEKYLGNKYNIGLQTF